MRKLLAVVIATMFATVSFNVLAAAHAGAAKDDKKMEKKSEVKSKDGKAVQTKDGKKVESKEEKKK